MHPSPDDLVAQAQAGDEGAREVLLRDYQPFVLRVVSRVQGGYVTGSSEEASIGLVAFNEAIDSYRPDRGVAFLTFCETVIRRRLIDHYRREVRRAREIPLSTLQEEDEEGSVYAPVEVEAARAAHQAYVETWERREEVTRFGTRLKEIGLSLRELVRISPRHRDARQRALRAARYLAGRPGLGRQVLERGELPVRELEANLGLGRKMLERNRKYILAMTLVLLEDFPYLQDYLRDSARGLP
ncbi:MAG: RNA polymerase sigma-I factor [Bacillota bacterium]|nr:RNA polymerase sigma-I factor [Bacillota bacterium]